MLNPATSSIGAADGSPNVSQTSSDAVEDHTAGVIAQDSLIHGDHATLRNVGEPGWSLLWPGPLIWPGDHAMPSAEVACDETLKNDFLAIQRNQ